MQGLKDTLKIMIPDSLRMAQLVLRRSAAWRATGLIFVHVPKNGGTSINTALYGRFMGHFRVRDIERLRPDLLRSLPSLAVTRNPWARTFSAWSFVRKGAEMTDGAQISHPQRYRVPAFATFERFVLDWLPGRDLTREDYVFRPQTQFLLDSRGSVGVRHLGRIEDPQSYLPFLEDTLGRKVEIRHLNRTADPLRYRQAYSDEMTGTIATLYAEDIEMFGYGF